MGRPRYQRSLPGGGIGNGMEDGWLRPDGATYQAVSAGQDNLYMRRGTSLSCRYYAFWVTTNLNGSGLRCNFDTLTDALEEVAAHPDVMSGGIWDRHQKRWAF